MDPLAFPTPVLLPSQLHNILVVAYFYPEIEIHLHGLMLRCNDNGHPTPFTVWLSQTLPQPWIQLARVPGTACASGSPTHSSLFLSCSWWVLICNVPHFKAHHPTLPSPSLPVSHPLTSNLDICANPLLISRNVGLNVLLIFIPLAWVSHFHEWSYRLTFGCMS